MAASITGRRTRNCDQINIHNAPSELGKKDRFREKYPLAFARFLMRAMEDRLIQLGPERHEMSPRTRPWTSDGRFSIRMGQRERRVARCYGDAEFVRV